MTMPEEIIWTFINDLLLNAISVLKNEEYQRRVWFKVEGPEVSTYLDTTVHLIDRCEAIFKYPVCSTYLGQDNYALLKKLYELVHEHLTLTERRINADLLEEDELFSDPKWHEIIALAGKVYLKLTDFVERKKL